MDLFVKSDNKVLEDTVNNTLTKETKDSSLLEIKGNNEAVKAPTVKSDKAKDKVNIHLTEEAMFCTFKKQKIKGKLTMEMNLTVIMAQENKGLSKIIKSNNNEGKEDLYCSSFPSLLWRFLFYSIMIFLAVPSLNPFSLGTAETSEDHTDTVNPTRTV
ncbi:MULTISPECIES: hypothetical protein [unclassified Lysinibacillus]|uniref:hypothetical protein n=1 Tax=unclassified Lysinibacillus TaxID=2636778 RepID=UPI0038262388